MNNLNLVAQIAALLGGLVLVAVSPLELFLYDRPFARRFLHVETQNIQDVRLWAFCIGARNLIAGAGVIVGLAILWLGDGTAGRIIVLTASWYMLLSSLAMAVADALGYWRPRGGSIMGTVASSLPPAVVLVAAAF